ncbi:MAG TPA: hypothetical protein VH442_17500, partial [Micromonosporaceae bacterium]
MSSESRPPERKHGAGNGVRGGEPDETAANDADGSRRPASDADAATTSGPPSGDGTPPAADAETTGGVEPTSARRSAEHRQLPHWLARVVRWLTTANPFMITLLSIFSALVIGAILIVIGDREVMSKFNYFFAAPSAALSGAWQQIKLAYTNLFEGAIFDPSTVGNAINGTATWE